MWFLIKISNLSLEKLKEEKTLKDHNHLPTNEKFYCNHLMKFTTKNYRFLRYQKNYYGSQKKETGWLYMCHVCMEKREIEQMKLEKMESGLTQNLYSKSS